jgi:hypothetical protein
MSERNERTNSYVGAFDPGFGGGKGAIVTPKGMLTAMVPSIVGMGDTNVGQLSLGDLGRQRRRGLPDSVVINDVTYLVGDGVERYAEPMRGLDFQRLRKGPEIRALFYDTFYHILGPGQHTLKLLIGLPVEVMLDDHRAKSTYSALHEWMVREHAFTVNDESVTLTVSAVSTMAQPVGALFAWGLNEDGRWDKRQSFHATVGVLDIGFNTLDLFAIEGAEIARHYTDGDTLGMRRAAEHLIQAVDAAYDMRISHHKADQLIRSRKPELHTPQGLVALDDLVNEALNRAASGILSFVQRADKWGDGRQFAYQLITGGGAEALRSQIEDAFPRAYIMPDPVTANAVGLARYAQRAFG